MGKLAERFTDANRSGVYRVCAAGVPRAAAREAGAGLLEMTAMALCEQGHAPLHRLLGRRDVRCRVLLVADAAVLGAAAHAQMLSALAAAAQASRDAGRAFFAVLVDPDARLTLPPLYHEKPDPSAA